LSSHSASDEEEKVPIQESSSLNEDDLYASEEILGPIHGSFAAVEANPIIGKEPQEEPPTSLALSSQPYPRRVNFRPSNAESELQRQEILLTKQTLRDFKLTALSLL
jgi:hypothetical protein